MARRVILSVTLSQVELVAHALAQELMEYGEPIPPFETRYPDKLESCLSAPFQKFAGKSLYRGYISKGASLFYLIIKNHPFQNGNKRVAVMTLIYFLYKNDYWLDVDNDKLYEFANEVANSESSKYNKELVKIRRFIRNNVIPNKDRFNSRETEDSAIK